jgi:hypothetical protein
LLWRRTVAPPVDTLRAAQVVTPDERGRRLLVLGQRVRTEPLAAAVGPVDILFADVALGADMDADAHGVHAMHASEAPAAPAPPAPSSGLCGPHATAELAGATGAAAVVVWSRCKVAEGCLQPCDAADDTHLKAQMEQTVLRHGGCSLVQVRVLPGSA